MISTDHLSPEELIELDALLIAESPVLPHSAYQTDPVGWAVDKLGIPEHTIRWSLNPGYDSHRWDGDPDPLVLVSQALADWKDAGIESGTTTGKTFWAAVLILWFLACWKNARVFTFAVTEAQLRLYIWMEIGKLWPQFTRHFPTAEITDLRIRMLAGSDAWGAVGYSVGVKADETVSSKASGMHAEHMLLVYEEMQGQPLPVIVAGRNACTAPHNLRLAIGNPNHRLDPLHKFCTGPGVVHVRISALDHPNVVTGNHNLVPGGVSQKSIDSRREEYGEADPIFQSRVRGISPEQASNALIRLEWLEASAIRWENRLLASIAPVTVSGPIDTLVSRNTAKYQPNTMALDAPSAIKATVFGKVTGKGVDVANSEHGDRACTCDFAGNAVSRWDAFACPDSNALGRQTKLEMDAAGLDPQRVGVDAIGVGAGTVNELRRLKVVVQALYAGGPAVKMSEKLPDGRTKEWSPDVNLFAAHGGLRSQMYWQFREDLRTNVIDVPYDKDGWEELIEHTFVDYPKTVVEPKDEVRDRLGRSPDKSDGIVMANWVRERAVLVPSEPPHKIAHRAHPVKVKDGKLVKPDPEPRSIEEFQQWAERKRRASARVPGFTQRVPTRKR